MKKLSVAQYATMIGITRQAILWRIKHNKDLPGVITLEKVGRAYVLTISA